MPLSPGTRLGPYEVVGSLGAGGMGHVYKARDTALDRDVALKILPGAFAHDPDRLRRFEREAKALAALNHPNIAQVYAIERTATGPALVMELVTGHTLDQLMARGPRPLPFDEVVSLGRQVAAALEAAHEAGIVHRDLKPANIMVTDESAVKVLDFGLAKLLEADAPASGAPEAETVTNTATRAGTILGTAAYMSPEQARGRPVDRRADIWALGVVLFELVTGRGLFEGETVSDTLAAVLRQVIPWDRLPPDAPAGLRRLLARCLERDPRRRLRDAGDAGLELDELMTYPASPEAPRDLVAGSRRRAERAAWAGLMAIAAAAAFWTGQRSGQSEPRWAQFTQLTSEAGVESTPVIAPDGDSIAYTRGGNLYVRRVGGRTATPVADDPVRVEEAPAFSPDSQRIAFHEVDPEGGIFVVEATGENERRISDTGFHPAWSPDGRHIAFCTARVVDPAGATHLSSLRILDLETGVSEPLTTPEDAALPAWSPSGLRVAYLSRSEGQRNLMTIAVSGGEAVPVTDDEVVDWSVTWHPDGRHLYFASDRSGVMNLWMIGIDEASGRLLGEPEPVTTGVQAEVMRPSFSADGSRLVFESRLTQTNPVMIPFDPMRLQQAGPPRYLFEYTGVRIPMSVSPDGKSLAIGNFGEPQEDVFVSRIDGSGLTRLTQDAFNDRGLAWAPDGLSLVFYSNRTGPYELFSIREDGSAVTPLTNRASDVMIPFFDRSGRVWGFDGRRGAPVTVDLTDPVPQVGTELPPILLQGETFWPGTISADGTRLAGIIPAAGMGADRVGWYDVASGEGHVLPESLTGWPEWLPPDGRHLVVAGVDRKTLVVLDVVTNAMTILGPFPFSIAAPAPAVSPDGRSIFVGGVTIESDIWMVERREATDRSK